jgi:hypothetical protein
MWRAAAKSRRFLVGPALPGARQSAQSTPPPPLTAHARGKLVLTAATRAGFLRLYDQVALVFVAEREKVGVVEV